MENNKDILIGGIYLVKKEEDDDGYEIGLKFNDIVTESLQKEENKDLKKEVILIANAIHSLIADVQERVEKERK